MISLFHSTRFSFSSWLFFPPPTDSCLSINVTLSKKNLFTLIFALIRTWLLLMLISSAFDRVPSERDSREWKKRPIARNDFPLSGIVLRDSSRKSAFIYFLLFGNKLLTTQWPVVCGVGTRSVGRLFSITKGQTLRAPGSRGILISHQVPSFMGFLSLSSRLF